MAGGRPRLIESPEEFAELAQAYFAEQDGKPVTITGLALAVGLSSRQALGVYESRPEFCDAVKRARARVESAYEARLWENNPTGAIFALKNMGWSDKQEVAVSGSVRIMASTADEAI